MRLFIPALKYQVMKILLNHSLRTLCNLIFQENITEGEFVV